MSDDTTTATIENGAGMYRAFNVPVDKLPTDVYKALSNADGDIVCDVCDDRLHYCTGGESGIGHNEQVKSYITYGDLAICGTCIDDAFDLTPRDEPNLYRKMRDMHGTNRRVREHDCCCKHRR